MSASNDIIEPTPPLPGNIFPEQGQGQELNPYIDSVPNFEHYISQEPSDYFTEIPITDNSMLALFSFYEEKQNEIYRTIRENNPEVVIEVDNKLPDIALLDIFNEGSTYNKDKIFLKFKQEIQCVSNNPIIESYIDQAKSDWHRTPFYSNKYNNYYKKDLYQNHAATTDKNIMPYLIRNPDADKLFLITADAINNYFMSDVFSPSLQINTTENIEKNIGEIKCDCEKLKDSPLICAGFNKLEIPDINVKKILYNLSFINQAQKSQLILRFQALLTEYAQQYSGVKEHTVGEDSDFMYNFGEGEGYSYFDVKHKSFVYFNTLIIMITSPSIDPIFVPVYKIMNIFPFEMNDYYYSCLYVDNDPPSNVGNTSNWYGKKSLTPVTNNYYQFLRDKINWYSKKFVANPDDFINGRYNGSDYLKYIDRKANEFKKTHKPYKYVYKSPKFIPPEKVSITSSKLLGGRRSRRRRVIHKRVTRRRVTRRRVTRRRVTRRRVIHKKPRHTQKNT